MQWYIFQSIHHFKLNKRREKKIRTVFLRKRMKSGENTLKTRKRKHILFSKPTRKKFTIWPIWLIQIDAFYFLVQFLSEFVRVHPRDHTLNIEATRIFEKKKQERKEFANKQVCVILFPSSPRTSECCACSEYIHVRCAFLCTWFRFYQSVVFECDAICVFFLIT